MPADDIYLLRANYEGPSQAAGWGAYYRQTVTQSAGTVSGANSLALAFESSIVPALVDMLSDDWWLASISVRNVYAELGPSEKEPPWEQPVAAQVGQRVGPSLPANDTANARLFQSAFTARHNGRIFLPGIAEGDTDGGVLDPTFVSTQFTALAVAVVALLAEIAAGLGRWELGVINGTVLNAAPPVKDWSAAFAPVAGVSTEPIIGSQRRRTTKVRGYAL